MDQPSFIRPNTNSAGFWWTRRDTTDPLPLLEAGELWRPTAFEIHEHRHTGWELYLQVTGRSVWNADGQTFHLEPGGHYLMPPGCPHHSAGKEHSAHHFYYVVFDLNHAALQPEPNALCSSWTRQPHHGPSGGSLEPTFLSLIREVCLNDPHRTLAVRTHLTALCIECTRLMRHTPLERQAGLMVHPAAERARQMLQARPQHPWKLKELARLCGVSPQHLIDCYRTAYGQTPMHSWIELRLKRALRELQTSTASITDIALDCGFSSSQHFAKAIRKRYGCTSSELRTANRSPRASL